MTATYIQGKEKDGGESERAVGWKLFFLRPPLTSSMMSLLSPSSVGGCPNYHTHCWRRAPAPFSRNSYFQGMCKSLVSKLESNRKLLSIEERFLNEVRHIWLPGLSGKN